MVVGVLILSGAVNTSMIGANGILNRVADDGVLGHAPVAGLLDLLRRDPPDRAEQLGGKLPRTRAGLLDGRRATTHWAVCDALQRRYPTARVEADPIFVRDGKVSTSAGVTGSRAG